MYLAAGQILYVSGKADVLDCHLVIQNTESPWEMSGLGRYLSRILPPSRRVIWLWASLTLARGGDIDRRAKMVIPASSSGFFLAYFGCRTEARKGALHSETSGPSAGGKELPSEVSYSRPGWVDERGHDAPFSHVV